MRRALSERVYRSHLALTGRYLGIGSITPNHSSSPPLPVIGAVALAVAVDQIQTSHSPPTPHPTPSSIQDASAWIKINYDKSTRGNMLNETLSDFQQQQFSRPMCSVSVSAAAALKSPPHPTNPPASPLPYLPAYLTPTHTPWSPPTHRGAAGAEHSTLLRDDGRLPHRPHLAGGYQIISLTGVIAFPYAVPLLRAAYNPRLRVSAIVMQCAVLKGCTGIHWVWVKTGGQRMRCVGIYIYIYIYIDVRRKSH